MHQEPNSMNMHPDIPPTQPIEEPMSGKKRPSEISPRESEPTGDTTEPIKPTPETPKRTSRPAKPNSSTLNDSPFTPLSMRALYYAPEGENDIPDGIPEGDINEALSPDTSTTTVRKKGTNLIFDASFPTPQPSPQQYMLKVCTAAFCHDEIRLAGLLNPPKTTPQIPLHSLCGTVISTPREDDEREEGPRFRIGDVVFGLVSYTRDGGAADYVVATEKELTLKPYNINVSEAAALALPALTAWQALFRYAGLDPDVPGGLNGDESGVAGNATGRWMWQRKRRDTPLGSRDYGYGYRKSTGAGAGSGRSGGMGSEQRGGLATDIASGSASGNGSGRWVWQWNRNGATNDTASGSGKAIDRIPGTASTAGEAPPDKKSVRRESLKSLVSGNPRGTKAVPRAASTVDPNPKSTVRRNSLIGLVKGNANAPGTSNSTAFTASANGHDNGRRASLAKLVSPGSGRRGSKLGSLISPATNGNGNGNGVNKLPKIRVLITNARDNDIGRIAVQILRAESLFPDPVRPWVCVTGTQVEADIIEKDWQVDEIIIIPHLPSPDECNIAKVFRTRRWPPVDIVLDCAGGVVFHAAHAEGVVKDYGAVLTVVDGKVAQQSPLVPENDVLGEKRRGIKSRFVPVNPDGPALERIAELVEDNLVRGRESSIVDIARAADLLAAGAAGTAGSRRGGMVVVRVNTAA